MKEFDKKLAEKIQGIFHHEFKPSERMVKIINKLNTVKDIEEAISKHDLYDQTVIMKYILIKSYDTKLFPKLGNSKLWNKWCYNNSNYLLYFGGNNEKEKKATTN